MGNENFVWVMKNLSLDVLEFFEVLALCNSSTIKGMKATLAYLLLHLSYSIQLKLVLGIWKNEAADAV